MKRTSTCLLALIFLSSACTSVYINAADNAKEHYTTEQNTLKVSHAGNDNAIYAFSMIKLALAHCDKKYKLKIVNDGNLTSVRFKEDAKNGVIDIMWAAGDKDIEEELLPIRIPLYKGLLGFRIFIIKKTNQHKFDQVNTLDDLRALKFGQGAGWPDAAILEANGMSVVHVTKYPSLFYMTDGERFDAFPRGVHEPFSEIINYPDLDLAVENNLMLVYKMPYYLFVSRDRPQLAKDLTDGLNAAIADGSFDRLFYSTQTVKDVMQKANIKSRKVFYLENPTLHKLTPLERKELWIDPNQMHE